MIWVLLVSTALAGNRWSGFDGDVAASADVSLPAEAVTAAFADVGRASRLFSETCATGWATDVPGLPAEVAATLTWEPSWVHRPLRVVVDDSRPGRRVTWDLQGRKADRGFWLVVDVVAREGGSTVTVSSPLDPPGWPLRGLFFRKIRPAWAACYADALLALDPAAELRSVTGPVEPVPTSSPAR